MVKAGTQVLLAAGLALTPGRGNAACLSSLSGGSFIFLKSSAFSTISTPDNSCLYCGNNVVYSFDGQAETILAQAPCSTSVALAALQDGVTVVASGADVPQIQQMHAGSSSKRCCSMLRREWARACTPRHQLMRNCCTGCAHHVQSPAMRHRLRQMASCSCTWVICRTAARSVCTARASNHGRCSSRLWRPSEHAAGALERAQLRRPRGFGIGRHQPVHCGRWRAQSRLGRHGVPCACHGLHLRLLLSQPALTVVERRYSL
jgi:hypothetical protein